MMVISLTGKFFYSASRAPHRLNTAKTIEAKLVIFKLWILR